VLGDAPPQHLADVMHRAWVDFVRTGDPGWSTYDLDARPVMRFADQGGGVVLDPQSARRAVWDGRR